MKIDILPHNKAPATLLVTNRNGVALPIVKDTFEECAWLLKQIWPPRQGCEIWIESMGQKHAGALVNALFKSDRTSEPG